MTILETIHKNMYGKSILTENSPFKSIQDERFIKLYNRVISLYPNESNLYGNFKSKLFTYLSQEQSKKFPINLLNKKEYPTLINLIHKLDNANAEISLHKDVKIEINPNINNIPIVYHNEEHNITVYRADTIFQSIKLGQGTNFCISANNLNPTDEEEGNLYYYYKYDSNSSLYENRGKTWEQKSTIYFVHSPNQLNKYKILAIDYYKNGTFLYTDVRNQDKHFPDYNDMKKKISGCSPDLKIIPENIFQWVDQPISSLSDTELLYIIESMEYPQDIMTFFRKIKTPSEQLQLRGLRAVGIHFIDIYSKDYKPSDKIISTYIDMIDHAFKTQYDYNTDMEKRLYNNLFYKLLQCGVIPNEKLQLLAVSKNPLLFVEFLKHGITPTNKVLTLAIQQNGAHLLLEKLPEYNIHLTDEMEKIMVAKNPKLIQFIEYPSEELQMYVVDTVPFDLIKNPSPKVIQYMQNLYDEEGIEWKDKPRQS